jgi:putative oxidoreductase
MDLALLVARLVFGGLFAAHGSQKLFGWFGGYGLEGTGGFFESIGFRPGRLFAIAAGAAEFFGGLLLALGLLTPLAATLIVSVMLVAIVTVHWSNGLLATGNGVELPLLYGVAASTLALGGPGKYALDTVLGLTPFWTPEVVVGAIGLGLIGGALNVALRRPNQTADAR